MTLRIRTSHDIIEVSNDEFRQLVRDGVVHGDTPVWGKIFTDGNWWTAADLRMFHECSPAAVPKGPHLIAEEAREERLEAQKERVVAARKAMAVGRLEAFGLPPLDRYSGTGVVGAARLWKMPAFRPDSVVTVVFAGPALRVQITEAATNYSSSAPHLIVRRTGDGTFEEVVPEPFDPLRVTHLHIDIARGDVGGLFGTWEGYAASSRDVGFCQSPALDGVSYAHEFLVGGAVSEVSWHNPTPDRHPRQYEFIRAYGELERVARRTAGKR